MWVDQYKLINKKDEKDTLSIAHQPSGPNFHQHMHYQYCKTPSTAFWQ